MDTENVFDTVQEILRDARAELVDPHDGECLLCFVARQLDEYGCNGTHRFAEHYRDRNAPRATALIGRLSRMGACCCDCEVFLNAYGLSERYLTPGYWTTDAQGWDEYVEPQGPASPPPCEGARRGSTQPCGVWQRRYHGYW